MKNFLQTRLSTPTQKWLEEVRYEEHRTKQIIDSLLHSWCANDLINVEQEEAWLEEVKKTIDLIDNILNNENK